jgi:hypothetical protein
MDRRSLRREEVEAVVQVSRPRAAGVAAAADDALDGRRELSAAGQRQGAEQPPRSMTIALDSWPLAAVP